MTNQDLIYEEEWALQSKEEMKEFHYMLDKQVEESNKQQDKEVENE